MEFELSLYQFIAACSIVAIASAVQGSVGFGFALVSVPVFVMIDPMLVPGAIIPLVLIQTTLMVLRERGDIDLGGLGWSISGRLVGTVFGAAFLAILPGDTLTLAFGIMVMLAVGLSLARGSLQRHRSTLLGAGLMSGFMGTTSSIGGPPIVLVYQDAKGPQVRSTLGLYFFVGAIQTLIALVIIGRFGMREIIVAGSVLPALLLGQLASSYMTGHLDRGHTRKALLTVAGISGIVLIIRGITG